MARGFRKSRGWYVAGLDDSERGVLVSLFEQTVQLLESAAPPESPGFASDRAANDTTTGLNPTGEANDPEDTNTEFEELMRSAGWEATQSGTGGFSPPGIDEEALRSDPALGRLLPDGHHDDPLAAAEFRRFSADGVRQAKITRLFTAIEAIAPDGEPLKLAEPEAVALLVSLTDVRLVLAERLGLHSEEDVEALEQAIADGEAAEAAPVILTYDFLTWLQETLAGALSK
ncbi:MAG: DUF2017 family protein [Dermatophilus congolensis]|nr:DUF2017 family protein [Dermatophilus congolensis]